MLPVTAIALIAVGILFLLQLVGYWSVREILPFSPVILIALGVYIVYERVTSRRQHEEQRVPAYDDPTTELHP